MRLIRPLALLLTFAALPAYAGPLFGQLDRLCLTTRGDIKTALALAGADGWVPVARDRQGREGLTHVVGASTLTLRVEEKLTSGALVQTCEVSSRPADPTVLREIEAWAKVAPIVRTAHSAMYGFLEEEDGRHMPLTAASPATRTRTLSVALTPSESVAFAVNTIAPTSSN